MKVYRVVIVEDDQIIRKSIVNSEWEKINAQVVGEASDGERALSIIEEAQPQLIVTDINMPFMDGITFAKKVREMDSTVRIIFLTGYDDFEYVHEAVLLKSDDYLLKPINHDILLEKAEMALVAWSEENEKEKKLTASLPLLQQEFLSQVLFNGENKDHTDIQNELLELGIYLTGPDFMILNVRVPEYNDKNGLYYYLREWQIDNEIEILSFQYNEGFIIISVEENDVAWVDRFENDLQSTFYVKHNKELQITASSIYSEMQDIETGIIEAKSKMEYQKIQNQVAGLKEFTMSDDYKDDYNQIKSYIDLMKLRQLPLEEVKRFVFSIVAYLCVVFNHNTIKTSEQLNQFEIGQEVLQARSISEVLEIIDTLMDKIEESSNKETNKDTSESLIYLALDFIGNHYTDSELSLVKVANEIHITPPYLSNLFKDKTGKNFTEYLLELRMEKAKEMLEVTQMRVQQIAEEIGYLSPHYFSSSFKKYTGKTPLEYRKSLLKNSSD